MTPCMGISQTFLVTISLADKISDLYLNISTVEFFVQLPFITSYPIFGVFRIWALHFEVFRRSSVKFIRKWFWSFQKCKIFWDYLTLWSVCYRANLFKITLIFFFNFFITSFTNIQLKHSLWHKASVKNRDPTGNLQQKKHMYA